MTMMEIHLNGNLTIQMVHDDNYASVDGLSLTPDDYDDDHCYVPQFGSDFIGNDSDDL